MQQCCLYPSSWEMEARASGAQGQSGVVRPCLRKDKKLHQVKFSSCFICSHEHLVHVDNQSQRTGVTESEFWCPQNCGVEQNVLGTGFCHLKSTDNSGQL